MQRIKPNIAPDDFPILLKDPRRHYLLLEKMSLSFLVETTLVMYRRGMLGAIRNPTVAVTACILTSFEEALLRSTMVYRDTFFAKLLGKPEPSVAEVVVQRKIWSAASAMSMYIEVTSIITSRAMYILFRPHRL